MQHTTIVVAIQADELVPEQWCHSRYVDALSAAGCHTNRPQRGTVGVWFCRLLV